MNNYYQNQLPPEQLQRQLATQRRRNQQTIMRQLGMARAPQPQGGQAAGSVSAMSDTNMMTGADSLDDIIQSNSNELNRRRSLPPQPFQPPQVPAQGDATNNRRMSMMEFGNPNDAFRAFQFGNMNAPDTNDGMVGAFPNMIGNMGVPSRPASFTRPNMMAMSGPGDFSTLPPDVMNSMMDFSNLSMGSMQPDPASVTMFNSQGLAGQFPANALGPVSTDFPMSMGTESAPLGAGPNNTAAPIAMEDGGGGGAGAGDVDGDEDMITVTRGRFAAPDAAAVASAPPAVSRSLNVYQPSMLPTLSREASSAASFQSPISSASQSVSNMTQPNASPTTSANITPLAGVPTPKEIKAEKNVSSKSGFDMVRALYYVATRPNPEVQLGAVDMSCAFVVCDVTLNDCPIVYVSDNFQNLTGYSRHDIVGQNCRFLQAPDGKVEAGSKREFVENSAVYNLKKKIREGREVQQSLINYRKGGKPFLNLLTMIPIPWDTKDIRYFVGFQIDLVECPDAIAGQEMGGVQVNYKHSDIGQYIWTPPASGQWEPESGQTLGVDDVSTLLQQLSPKGVVSDWHKQSWDKMLLENTDDVVHVLSLKGLFLYLSPSCRKVLEYDSADLVGNSLSSICHPSDIVPVTRELKDTAAGSPVNIVFRIRRKQSGYTWFESHGSLFVEQGKGRKCIILVGRKRPVFALHRRHLDANGGIGDAEFWTKLSTSGMFLFVSSSVRSLLDLQPENLEGTSIQDLMRKESRGEFGRSIEKARRGKMVACKHEVQNRRGQVLQAQTILYPGDAGEGQKPTFLLAQTRLLKASSRAIAPAAANTPSVPGLPGEGRYDSMPSSGRPAQGAEAGIVSAAHGETLALGTQDAALASDDNIFDELKTTRCASWQYELRQMEKVNRLLAEELGQLLSSKKKRKRRKGVGNVARDCANCHTRNTPEWRRGPSGQRDLCNSCGLRWAKQTGRVSPRNSSRGGNDVDNSKKSNSPIHSFPLHYEATTSGAADDNGGNANAQAVDGSRSVRRDSAASGGNGSGNGHGRNGDSSTSISPNGGGSSATGSTSNANMSGGGRSTGGGGSSSSSNATATGGMSGKGDHSVPPPSNPLFEGGSGFKGIKMEMTSIREERENGA